MSDYQDGARAGELEFRKILQEMISEPLFQSHAELGRIIDAQRPSPADIAALLTDLGSTLENFGAQHQAWQEHADHCASAHEVRSAAAVQRIESSLKELEALVATSADAIRQEQLRFTQTHAAVQIAFATSARRWHLVLGMLTTAQILVLLIAASLYLVVR
ncbi:MAG: hypothetical protein ACRDTA_01030 [Pseudonocardiaceae bacterium]